MTTASALTAGDEYDVYVLAYAFPANSTYLGIAWAVDDYVATPTV